MPTVLESSCNASWTEFSRSPMNGGGGASSTPPVSMLSLGLEGAEADVDATADVGESRSGAGESIE